MKAETKQINIHDKYNNESRQRRFMKKWKPT